MRCKKDTSPSQLYMHSQTAAQPRRTNKKTSRKIDADKAKGIDLCYLCERPRATLDAELCVAELTVAGVGRRQPLLQAALVHRAQGARAVARGQETLTVAALVANAADGTITATK